MPEIPIKNAEWWHNHSHVILKGVYTLEDDSFVANAIFGRPGDLAIRQIERMVKEGVVSVSLPPENTRYEVKLPQEARNLLPADAEYILSQIQAAGKPMSAKEQADFLARANAPTKES